MRLPPVLAGWRYALFIGGFGGLLATTLYPIIISPYLHPEKWNHIQEVNRAGMNKEKIQPGGLKVWSDPFKAEEKIMTGLDMKQHFSLKNYNTFGIDVTARYFLTVDSVVGLKTALNYRADKVILGGGSNVLFTTNIDALVLHICIKGIDIISEGEGYVDVKVSAGELWHDFVLWCVKRDYGGVENLSLIPGTVGAAPVQNIGAYGVEVKDSITHVEVVHIRTNQVQLLSKAECEFGYRRSVFNSTAKGDYVVTRVLFRLTRGHHRFVTSYATLNEMLTAGSSAISVSRISDAVVQTRRGRYPDPRVLGNAGCFFKNPVISPDLFVSTRSRYPAIPGYPEDGRIKVPAGWLIEKANWKGKCVGNVGVYSKQALVLVNHGDARGADILNLSYLIQKSVSRMFNISLMPEVESVGLNVDNHEC